MSVRYVYCPGCDSRIHPGQDVVGVQVASADDGYDALWHRTCYDRWYLAEREKNRAEVEARMAANIAASQSTDHVVVTNGCSSWSVDNPYELWHLVWRALAFAMVLERDGKCRCGCTVAQCEYCLHECDFDNSGEGR